MVFHSLRFALFSSVVFSGFALLGPRLRWAFLLASSLLFFAGMGFPALVAALLVVTCASYSAGLAIGANPDPRARRFVLWSAVLFNVAVLAIFKYLPAILGNIGIRESSGLLAMLGVSYFTFQGISYVVDVYVQKTPVERHFGYFALYMAFFPKLLQGPIERAGDLIPQLRKGLSITAESCREGALLFAWGLFKKTVVADRAAPIVDAVYGSVDSYSGLTLVAATYLYAIQLYCDFSGYTDMALGVARCFGVKLTQNFANPYSARSVADFWRRWHISLSRWLLDYVFTPLQFALRHYGTAGSALAIVATFFVSGIWHGAGWTFVIWGLMHGLYMAVSIYMRPVRKWARSRGWLPETRWVAACQMFTTIHLVMLSWIFFRAADVADAMYVVTHLGFSTDGILSLLLMNGSYSLAVLMLGFSAVIAVDMSGPPRLGLLLERPVWFRWPAYYALASAILVFGAESTSTFIYFQF